MYQNPFHNDADRAQIWEMLVERDIEAFLAADWSPVANDFVAEEFFGIDAGKQHNPNHWTIRFSSLDKYRDVWLADAVASQQLTHIDTARAGIINATTLVDIEISGDRALAHKKFNGQVEQLSGDLDLLYWQTLYVCKRIHGSWKISSFVGYLPYDLGHAP